MPLYLFKDCKCLGRKCWMPDRRVYSYDMKHKPLIGMKMLKRESVIPICAYMFDYGCPKEDSFDMELQKERIRAGWRSKAI